MPESPRETDLLEGLRRGINLGNKLDPPNEGDYGPTLERVYFESAAAAGFDHVRLPVRFSAHAADEPPYTIDGALLARVDFAVATALELDLGIVVDLHHYEELMQDPDAHADRFVALWQQLAERYRDQPDAVVFELLNEPSGELGSDKLNALHRRAIATVRQSNPRRRIIVDCAHWANAEYLHELELPQDDRRLIASFHHYQPIMFTHQGASWMGPEYQATGIVFPGPGPTPVEPPPAVANLDWAAAWFEAYNGKSGDPNSTGMPAVVREFERAAAYAARTGRPIYVGEFGAINIADEQSRVRFTRAVREQAEERDMGWAYWDDSGAFQAFDRQAETWHAGLLRALLPASPSLAE